MSPGDNMYRRTLIIENKHFFDLNPLGFGEYICLPGYEYGYENINYYLIHYVVSGKGKFIYNDNEYDIEPGKIFIIKKEETAKYKADKLNPWHYIWISFDGNLANNFNDLSYPVLPFNSDIFINMLKIFDLNKMAEEYLAAYLFLLFREIFSEKSSENYVEKIKNYINMNYMKKIKISEIAMGLNLNRKYLSRIFKEKTGMTMQQYLLITKMTHAKSLLSKGFNVSQTAAMLSYEDQFVFSKAFKKYYGYSPSAIKSGK